MDALRLQPTDIKDRVVRKPNTNGALEKVFEYLLATSVKLPYVDNDYRLTLSRYLDQAQPTCNRLQTSCLCIKNYTRTAIKNR